MCNHHIIPFIYPLYTVYAPMCTDYTCIYTTYNTIYTPLNTSKHPIYTSYTPHIRLTRQVRLGNTWWRCRAKTKGDRGATSSPSSLIPTQPPRKFPRTVLSWPVATARASSRSGSKTCTTCRICRGKRRRTHFERTCWANLCGSTSTNIFLIFSVQ